MKTKYSNVFVNPTEAEVGCHRAVMAFDLDSVLNNMGRNLREYIADQFELPIEFVTDTSAGFEKFHFSIPGITDKTISKMVNKYVREESPSSLTTPYMSRVMSYVYERTGSPIAVVTARHESTVGVTKRWLEENLRGVPFFCYIVARIENYAYPKAKVLEYLNTRAFIDDRWATVESLVGKIDFPVLFRAPWNRRPVWLSALEVDDLRDVIPLLNILTGEVPTAWPSYVPYPFNEGGYIV
jgi:hypothetical protein